jgi:phage terminase small subunit
MATYLRRNKENTGGPRLGKGSKHKLGKGVRRGGRVSDSVPAIYSKAPKGVRIRDARVSLMARRVSRAFPWINPSADRELVRLFCQLVILSDECYAKVRLEGIVNPKTGVPHRLLCEFRACARVLADVSGRLGLSPRDRAQLQSSSTSAALDRIDLGRVDRILKARTGGASANGDAEIEEVSPSADDDGSN